MHTIKILDEDTVSKISAGEVVERPASAVKELVENSIDAGARVIEIELKNGGKDFIRVTDDGSGMTRDEASLSLMRHSTSKIDSADDLFNITTLGFRGEALPSIAVISRFEMLTKGRDRSQLNGTLIKVEGGKQKSIEPAGCPAGSTIKVSDLFFNTPARKKFLKSNSTELTHILDVVSKYVLAYPAIAFKLKHNGEELISSPGDGSLENAFAKIYGLDVARNAVKVSFSSDHVRIEGYVAQPTVTRIGRDFQAFFVNGRYVKNFLLSRALSEAYRNLIPKDRNPIAALFIKVDPKDIDVNVHPTKREIKFARTNDVLSSIRAAVSNALGLKEDASSGDFYERAFPDDAKQWRPEMAAVLFNGIASRPGTTFDAGNGAQKISPLCQILNTYIIALDGDGFILIDQHAAHERIRYEEVRGKGLGVRGQNLLIPENLELNKAESIILKENLGNLRSMGFEVEEFGGESFIVRSVPAMLSKISPREVIIDVISELKNFGSSISAAEKLDALYKLVACHSAVRSGDKLSYDEMSSLLVQLLKTKDYSTCPHGRPTMIRFSGGDLEKMFKRI